MNIRSRAELLCAAALWPGWWEWLQHFQAGDSLGFWKAVIISSMSVLWSNLPWVLRLTKWASDAGLWDCCLLSWQVGAHNTAKSAALPWLVCRSLTLPLGAGDQNERAASCLKSSNSSVGIPLALHKATLSQELTMNVKGLTCQGHVRAPLCLRRRKSRGAGNTLVLIASQLRTVFVIQCNSPGPDNFFVDCYRNWRHLIKPTQHWLRDSQFPVSPHDFSTPFRLQHQGSSRRVAKLRMEDHNGWLRC